MILKDDVIGEYTVVKRRGMKRLKLSVAHDGKIRVTMPLWAPLYQARSFVASQREWLSSKRTDSLILQDGAVIGRSHVLSIHRHQENRLASRLTANEARLTLPQDLPLTAEEVQTKASTLLGKALKQDTQQRIVPRLEFLASATNTKLGHIRVRQLKSRWGSCSSKNDITLSYFLAQLPDKLVDYVLIHELMHTRVHAHNQQFWKEVETYDPDYKQHRKRLRDYRPTFMLMA